MRCPDCNKFVSFDTDADPEIEREDMQGTTAEVSIRITNNCSECGQELKEARFDFEHDFADDIAAHFAESPECKDRDSVSLSVDASRTDRRQTKDRNGKTIVRSRYQKQFYGVDATLTINCDECDENIGKADLSDECQASGMDELV